MTELKRTTQAVDEIEQLVQRVLDVGSDTDVQQLSQLVGNTAPTVQKLRQKAAETDPAKKTYGAQTCEKVRALASRWDSVEGLAHDVLRQRGASVAAPAQPAQTPPPAPAPVFSQPWVPPRATPSAPQQAPAPSRAEAVPIEPAARPPASSAAPRPDGPSRRELAARAAEARLQGGAAPAKAPASAAAASSAPAAAAAAAPQAVPVPRVARMDALLHLVHCVFLGHGFVRDEGSEEGRGGAAILQGIGPFRVRYEHKTHRPIAAMYVPVQNHLVVYAYQEGIEGAHAPGRATVQLGMPVESVQAKIDYLLLYPLVYRQCLPAMTSLPPEVCFSVLANLAIPSLAVVGRASRGLSSAVFEDDVLWWRVLTALPPSSQLHGQIKEAMNARDRGEAVAPGTYRRLVREEVMRAREEAEQQRQRREAEARMRERLRDPLLVQPPRQPRFPGGPGGFMIGGPDDLAPGGGFLPGPFGPGGGRRPPFGGGGGGFGGLF